jgi:hypothetical protein
MVDVDMNSTPPKWKLVYELKVLLDYQKSWTQKASTHLKEGGVIRNKRFCECGKWTCAS